MELAVEVPSVGESVFEVYIVQWYKAPGEPVAEGEPLVEIESEKATMDIPAPATGILSHTLKEPGDSAEVGEVIAHIKPGQDVPESPSSASPPEPAETAPTPSVPPAPVTQEEPARVERRVVMSPVRRRIAARLVEARQTQALVTTFNEIDMSRVIEWRTEHREAFQDKHGVKLGLMSFFIKAVVAAMAAVPELNAQIEGDHIVYRDYFDIGIAVGGGRALVVPVLRNVEDMSWADIERTLADLAARARTNELTVEELTDGTFTISNGGVYGSLLSTPLVNPPQSGVLGLHRIQDRPVAENGQIVVKPMMYVALTYDHRLVDGREAVTFLGAVKHYVEDPARLALDL